MRHLFVSEKWLWYFWCPFLYDTEEGAAIAVVFGECPTKHWLISSLCAYVIKIEDRPSWKSDEMKLPSKL